MEKNIVPDVSIIIITYKTPLMILRRCIQSLQNQTLTNIEIILLDSNNKGSSYKEAIQSDSNILENIIYIEIPEKNEFINGKNAALAKCTGKYITILSAQDTMPSKRLEEIVSIFHNISNKKNSSNEQDSENGEYDVIFTDMQVQQKNILESSNYHISTQKYQYLPQLIIQRSSLQEIGEFDTALVAHCDEEMWFRINSLLRIHHVSTENTTISVNPDFYNVYAPLQAAIGYRQIAVKYAKYFKKNKRQKKILYYKIASKYKTAGYIFRYIQFQIKALFTGNFQSTKKETTNNQVIKKKNGGYNDSTKKLQSEAATKELETSTVILQSLKEALCTLENRQEPSHFILVGNEPEQIINASKQITKLMKKTGYLSQGKIAKITAERLNEIDFVSFQSQLKGNCLLIETTENLLAKTINHVFLVMKEYHGDFAVILSIDEKTLEKLFCLNPELKQKFDYIIDISNCPL